MKKQTSTKARRLEHFAWLAAVLVVLQFISWDLHQALEQHAETDHSCQVCLVMERGGDAPPAVAGHGLLPEFRLAPGQGAPSFVFWSYARHPLPRGPPAASFA
ncbi:MAG: hypothetical protein ACNA8J_07405 [Gammaproteobacteria bacterium]